MAGPEPGDRGELAGLVSRPDLNGRRVEVREQVVGQDGPPRFAVRLLFGVGAGSVMKVKAANLELDKDHALDDPAMATLVAEMQALAPGATPMEERPDWAGGLPIDVLAKIAETVVAQKAGSAVPDFIELGSNEYGDLLQYMPVKLKRQGSSLFPFAMVCKGWRKAQLKVGVPLRTRVSSDVIPPGRVELVKWALAEGCPREGRLMQLSEARIPAYGPTVWDNLTMFAAGYGHLKLLQWLVQDMGFPVDLSATLNAQFRGHQEVLQWLQAHCR